MKYVVVVRCSEWIAEVKCKTSAEAYAMLEALELLVPVNCQYEWKLDDGCWVLGWHAVASGKGGLR